MLHSLFGSRRRRIGFFAYAAVAVTLAAGVAKQGRGSYCRCCGLERYETRVLWFGFPVQQRVKYSDNTFHQLYARFVTAHRHHRWRGYTISDLEPLWLTGGVGCGHFPASILLPLRAKDRIAYPELQERRTDLLLVARLHDPARAAAVLTSFDLTRDTPREDAIFAALAQLRRISSAAEENQWWDRHHRCFRPCGEIDSAVH